MAARFFCCVAAVALWATAADDTVAQRIRFGSSDPSATVYQPISPTYPAPTLNGVAPFDPYAPAPQPFLGLPPASTAPTLPTTPLPYPPQQYTPPLTSPMIPPPTLVPAQPLPFTPGNIYERLSGNLAIGFQAAVLQAYPGAFASPSLSASFDPNFNLEFSPRFWVGIRGNYGLIVRGRYWQFNHGTSKGTLTAPGFMDPDLVSSLYDINVYALDVEVGQKRDIQGWDLEMGGAIRYAEAEVTQNVVFDFVDAGMDMQYGATGFSGFSGLGPGVFLGGRRELGWRGFTFLANTRLSFLFGNTNFSVGETTALNPPGVDPIPTIDLKVSNHVLQVWEMQVGVEWSRQLSSGARFFLGAFLEGQVWELPSSPFAISSDLGFFGPTFSVGLDW